MAKREAHTVSCWAARTALLRASLRVTFQKYRAAAYAGGKWPTGSTSYWRWGWADRARSKIGLIALPAPNFH
jgi:hypothetical protein